MKLYPTIQISVVEILTKAEWWTVDPYMRLRSVANMKIGDQFTGGQVARYNC